LDVFIDGFAYFSLFPYTIYDHLKCVIRLRPILNLVHQAEPLHLARLNTTGRSPGIPEGGVEDRLTHRHSSLRQGNHTVGLGIFFKVYSFRSVEFCTTGSPLVGCGCSPRTDGLGRREAIIRIYRPWRIARAPLRPPVSPLGKLVTPVRPGRLPLTP